MKHKTYVTFGQEHTHRVNNITFDKDCVAVIKSDSAIQGRELAFTYFGAKFCMEYPEAYWKHSLLEWFPRGYENVNF